MNVGIFWVCVMECMCAQTIPQIWKSFGGVESEPMLTPREKPPLLEAKRRIKPMTLHTQHTTNWAILAPGSLLKKLLKPLGTFVLPSRKPVMMFALNNCIFQYYDATLRGNWSSLFLFVEDHTGRLLIRMKWLFSEAPLVQLCMW